MNVNHAVKIEIPKCEYSKINGVFFQHCFRVITCSNGYIPEALRPFGDGKLWMDDKTLELETVFPKSILRLQHIQTISGAIISGAIKLTIRRFSYHIA